MRTFITQRAIAASPIMIGGDLPTLDIYSQKLLTNKDILACNQNGQPGTLIKENGGMEIWGTCTKDIQIKGWVGFFNRSDKNQEVLLSKTNIGLVTYYGNPTMEQKTKSRFNVKDIWGDEEYELNEAKINKTVLPGDVLFICYEEISK